jgi:hypothetical protein
VRDLAGFNALKQFDQPIPLLVPVLRTHDNLSSVVDRPLGFEISQ